MQPTQRKYWLPILIAAGVLALAALIVIFAVILPMNARTAQTQAALVAARNTTPKPTQASTPTPAPTAEPPWRIQIMRRCSDEGVVSVVEARDPEGRMLYEEREGVRKEYIYDTNDKLVKLMQYTILDDGSLRASGRKEYSYDAVGNELEELQYDITNNTDGQLESVLDERRSSTYDERGNIVRYEKSNKRSGLYEWEDTTYTYDTEERIVKTVCVNTHISEGSYTETSTYKFNAAGNQVEETHRLVSKNEWVDPYSERTTLEYNEQGQLIRENEYWNGRFNDYTIYQYDEEGRRRGWTNYQPNDSVNYRRELDENGDPVEKGVEKTYDDAGRLVEKIEANDDRTVYVYDDRGRLAREEFFRINSKTNDWYLRYYNSYEYQY